MKTKSPGLSRREFLSTLAGAGGTALIAPAWLRAAMLDPRVEQAMAQTIGIDMHNHVYPPGTEPHPHFTGGPPAPDAQQGPELLLTDELKRSGLSAVCASYVLDFAPSKNPGDARANFLQWMTAVDQELAKGHIRRALTLEDLQSAHDQGKPTIVQTVEGAQFIEGKLERVEEVHRRGLRHLQLLHMSADMVTPLGDTNTDPPRLGGLTKFGAEVVKECNRLGIVVDMAHAAHETVLGALKVATQPLIISHTNIDTWTGKDPRMAEMMKPRLISRDHAKVVADAGGVVGVWMRLANSPEEFVESLKAMIDGIGVDHVGIGTDSDLLSSRVGTGTNHIWPGLTLGFFATVVAEMLRQGFSAEDVRKVGGGNYCRVFGKVTAGKA